MRDSHELTLETANSRLLLLIDRKDRSFSFPGDANMCEEKVQSTLNPPTPEGKSLRILVVEDNPVNQKVALKMIASLGYGADVAGNGLEALEALRRQDYDLVLMDVRMPEMDGITATKRICEEWAPENRPRIVGITAEAIKGDREKCLEAGMDDYFTKPVRIQTVQEIIQSASLVKQERAAVETPVSFSDEAVLDQAVLATLYGELGEEGPALFKEIAEMFIEGLPQQVTALRIAFQERDLMGLERSAHSLKGSCKQLGARKMAECAARIERSARGKSLENVAEEIDLLGDYAELTHAALLQCIAKCENGF